MVNKGFKQLNYFIFSFPPTQSIYMSFKVKIFLLFWLGKKYDCVFSFL